ncbi:MAG: hypothetical protein JRE38_10540 [Deltaproteobacteria bacterium]|nr:hypothetical protein [Deltaproteobacteria bacterium]MBW2578492.1 hypothetical protein [Deltaproteobacteria bacterium]MBW2692637.1 hypothetical protein [Deltaproteobacteria bacterium]
MSFHRFMLVISCLLLSFAWVTTVHAKAYSLTGGGGQFQVGGGLPLPIQLTNPTATGTVFPSLLIPVKTGQAILGTSAMASQRKLIIPAGVLSKAPAQLTLGQFGQNPKLYAVATNLGFAWPAANAVMSTGARTGAKTTTLTTALGNNIRYSNPLASKFGGPAQFLLSPGPGQGRYPQVPVTLYGIAVPGAGNPPCVHTALTTGMGGPFPGPGSPACVAGLAQALPTGFAGPGGPLGAVITTPGGTSAAVIAGGPVPGVGIGAFGANGTVQFFTFTPAGTMAGFTNKATSVAAPFTTGMITLSAPFADGAPEIFTITGKDSRTAGGAGTIQLVSGALSQRTTSGPNANRGWVRLVLAAAPDLPALSPSMSVVFAVFMLATFGFAVRRFSTVSR